MFTIKGKYTTADIMIDNVEPECISQITEMINHPAFTNPVKIMPDCHSGKGSVIGFTMKASDKIIANCIGVDIGCGMLSVNLGNIAIDHVNLDKVVRNRIPFGKNVHDVSVPVSGLDEVLFKSVCKKIGIDLSYAVRSIGSVGGGNHFIEIGKSVKAGDVWVTIHSGSRNFGKKVCDYWQGVAFNKIKKAREVDLKNGIQNIIKSFPRNKIEKEIKAYRQMLGLDNIRSNMMEYLDGEDKVGYLSDMMLAQSYAMMNREAMLRIIVEALNAEAKDTIETIHNFIDFNDNIIRKGAIRSYIGEKMIIPLNMRDGILLCEGKSNPEWNYSAPHGAGRVMSRSKAKKELSLSVMKDEMNGIFSTSLNMNTLDESPDAYKDSQLIIDAIGPTATILDRILPIHNMKDSEGKG